MADEVLVTADSLTKVFDGRGGPVIAVDDVSFEIRHGETLGLVGESGSGKSTVARLLLRLQEPTSGTVAFRGQDLSALRGKSLRDLRRHMQMVFQNPYGSLLPHFTAVSNVAEPLRLHGMKDKEQRRAEALRLLDFVGVTSRVADLYPRQFSGGQQQRIAVARALALEPDLLVCDEPTSSLDVSIQAQILNLFQDLQSRLALTCMFISHNLAVVERIASRVMVMCQGRLVETAPTQNLFAAPAHPYTQALLSAVLPVRHDASPPIEMGQGWLGPGSLGGDLREIGCDHFVREQA